MRMHAITAEACLLGISGVLTLIPIVLLSIFDNSYLYLNQKITASVLLALVSIPFLLRMALITRPISQKLHYLEELQKLIISITEQIAKKKLQTKSFGQSNKPPQRRKVERSAILDEEIKVNMESSQSSSSSTPPKSNMLLQPQQLNATNEDLQAAIAAKDEAEENLNKVTADKEKLEGELKKAKEDLQTVNAKIVSLEKELQTMKTEKARVENKLQTLEEKSQLQEITLKELNKELEEKESIISELEIQKETLSQLQTELQETKQELGKANKQIKTHSVKNSKSEKHKPVLSKFFNQTNISSQNEDDENTVKDRIASKHSYQRRNTI